jgi:hypothetical protein
MQKYEKAKNGANPFNERPVFFYESVTLVELSEFFHLFSGYRPLSTTGLSTTVAR